MSDIVRSSSRLFGQPRLGIELGRRTLRSVLVVRGSVVRTSSAEVHPGESLETTVQQLVDAGCRGFWRRPRVCVAVGPSYSQLRRLVKLPDIDSERALRDLLRGSVGRFFVKNGVPLLTSSVRREGNGTGWAAAIDEPPVRAIAEACRTRRLHLDVVAPMVVALQRGVTGELLVAADGDVIVEAHIGSRGELRDVRRTPGTKDTATADQAVPVAALESLGEGAREYAAAYGATLIDRSESLALQAAELRQWQDTSVPTWRLFVALGVLLFAATLALMLPALRASRVAMLSTPRLVAINRQYRAAQWTEAELRRTTIALNELAAFDASRRSVIEFLDELTTSLSEGVWLQSIHVDEQGGTVIALAPRAASALDGLSELKSIARPVIVGAVSSEQIGPVRMERVTIRFGWRTGNAPGTPQ